MDITKLNMKIGNWNMQGLNSPGKIDILAEECERYQLDIVALTELHWIDQGKMKHGKWEIVFSGTENNRREKTENCHNG